MISRKAALLVAAVVAVAGVLGGCAMYGKSSSRQEDRFVRPGVARVSPSGGFTAYAEPGPPQNGVATWVVVVWDGSNAEVYRDSYAYSTRHGVGITWLSNADQLWVLSSDVGDAHVDRKPDGTWVKTAITPETINDIPEEIRILGE